MKLKYTPLFYAFMLIIALSLSVNSFSATMCGKISDYIYNDECDIIVANRNASKQIAITFDDGPSEKYTPEILDILKEYNVKATFFVVGKNAESFPEIIKSEYNNGHEIGNHTYSHPQMKAITINQADEEIQKTQEIIERIIGKPPKLFRPPGGYLNNSIVDKITSNGCKTVLWSWRQDTRDWESPPVEKIVNTVLSNLKDGDIILFHDYNSHQSPTPEALKIIIPKLKERGYEFVTVSELVK